MTRPTHFPPASGALKRETRIAGDGGSSSSPAPAVDEQTAEFASQLFENPAFERVMAKLQEKAIDRFVNSERGTLGENARDTAHEQITALEAIRADLKAMADDDKIHRQRRAQTGEF